VLDLLVVVVSPPGAALFEVVVEDSEDFSDATAAAGAAGAPSAPAAPDAPVAPEAPVAPDSPGGPPLQPTAAVPSRNAIPINAAMAPVFFFLITLFLVSELEIREMAVDGVGTIRRQGIAVPRRRRWLGYMENKRGQKSYARRPCRDV
jgi:hypothetical protein